MSFERSAGKAEMTASEKWDQVGRGRSYVAMTFLDVIGPEMPKIFLMCTGPCVLPYVSTPMSHKIFAAQLFYRPRPSTCPPDTTDIAKGKRWTTPAPRPNHAAFAMDLATPVDRAAMT